MQTLQNGIEVTESESLIPIKLASSWIMIKWNEPKRTVENGAAAIEQKNSAILLAASMKEDYSDGIVMSVGPGDPNYPVVVKPGETVMYFRQEARNIKVEDIDYDLVQASALIAWL